MLSLTLTLNKRVKRQSNPFPRMNGRRLRIAGPGYEVKNHTKLTTPIEGTDACNHAAAASRIPRAWEEADVALPCNARASGPSTVLLLPSLKAGRRNRAAEVAPSHPPRLQLPMRKEERRGGTMLAPEGRL